MVRNCKEILNNQLALYEIFNESESLIKSRKIKISEYKNTTKMTVFYLVNKDIAEKQKIYINY